MLYHITAYFILVLALVFIEIVLAFLCVPLGTAPNHLDLIGTLYK